MLPDSLSSSGAEGKSVEIHVPAGLGAWLPLCKASPAGPGTAPNHTVPSASAPVPKYSRLYLTG